MFEQVHALRPGTTIVYSQASVNVIFLGVKKLLEDSGNIEWYDVIQKHCNLIVQWLEFQAN